MFSLYIFFSFLCLICSFCRLSFLFFLFLHLCVTYMITVSCFSFSNTIFFLPTFFFFPTLNPLSFFPSSLLSFLFFCPFPQPFNAFFSYLTLYHLILYLFSLPFLLLSSSFFFSLILFLTHSFHIFFPS